MMSPPLLGHVAAAVPDNAPGERTGRIGLVMAAGQIAGFVINEIETEAIQADGFHGVGPVVAGERKINLVQVVCWRLCLINGIFSVEYTNSTVEIPRRYLFLKWQIRWCLRLSYIRHQFHYDDFYNHFWRFLQ